MAREREWCVLIRLLERWWGLFARRRTDSVCAHWIAMLRGLDWHAGMCTGTVQLIRSSAGDVQAVERFASAVCRSRPELCSVCTERVRTYVHHARDLQCRLLPIEYMPPSQPQTPLSVPSKQPHAHQPQAALAQCDLLTRRTYVCPNSGYPGSQTTSYSPLCMSRIQ